MGKFDGRVVLITGGARGQGRSHALAFAREGADVAFCDIAAQLDSVPYPMSRSADLDETTKLVEELDRRCVGVTADVRDGAQVRAFVERAVTELGRVDFLLANAGIFSSPAMEVGGNGITVNAVCPTGVDTTMIQNPAAYASFLPDTENPTREDAAPAFQSLNAIPVPWIEPIDISNAMVFLCSDEARYITGETLAVAAGATAANAG